MPPPPPQLWIAPDVRAAQGALLERLDADAAEVRADLGRLAAPLRVVVPGGSLREALLDALVRPPAAARVGVQVQTLWSIALEVLEAAGRPVLAGEQAFELAVRRAALAEPSLAAALGRLEDGAGLAAATVSDIASAGLDRIAESALGKALAARPPRERERALALVRVARAVRAELASLGRLRHADVYGAAAAALAERPERCAARELVVYGFASATGTAQALLAALARACATTWIAVRPEGADAALALARRSLAEARQERALAASALSRMAAFRATGFDDEARELARRVRALLDGGARPEDIGVVARALEPRATALRRAFEALGVPFGGAREPAGLQPATRRAAAVLDVLRDGPRCSAERWLDALGPDAGASREDVRCALAAAGVLRLDALAHLDEAPWVARGKPVALPQRGAHDEEGDAPGAGERPLRRSLDPAVLRDEARRARAVLERLEAWPEGGEAQDQRAALAELGALLELERDADVDALWRALLEVPSELTGFAPGPSRAELTRALADALAASDTPWLGGPGAGVRVLDAQSARGAAFRHLFVLGAERGVFPRAARGDALLGDSARQALAALASELGTREREEAEERWLLGALLGAADEVTVSWRHADLDGREIAASPAVADVLARAAAPLETIERRREVAFALHPSDARERALAVALCADRGALEEALGEAFEEAAQRFGAEFLPRGRSARELARARLAVLAELDPERSTREGRAVAERLGPYLGLAGQGALPSADGLFVTGLERLARCPWQAFLERGLGLERAPDPFDDLPDVDALSLGNTVHAALQALVVGARPVAPDELERTLQRAARETLWDAGVHLEGLALALARRARPFVERGLDLTARLEGERVPEAPGATPSGLRFRADLLVRGASGVVRFDFKTGKPISDRVRPQTRRNALIAAVRRGTHLQAVAYAAADDASGGGYLFLGEDLGDDVARVEVLHDDGELAGHFQHSVEVLEDAWRAGSVAPRPETAAGKANDACARCEVRDACLRDDSGVRARLRRLAQGVGPGGSADELALARLAGLWFLGAEASDDEEGA